MANLPKKTSLRVGVANKASASGRGPAVGASISNRKLGAVKPKPPPEPEPEPELEEVVDAAPAEAPLEDESLLGELSDAVIPEPQTGKLPLKTDEHLLSEKSLYGDDDPLDQLNKKKPAFPAKTIKPAAPAPAASKGSNRIAKAAVAPAKPGKAAPPAELEEAAPAEASDAPPADAEVAEPAAENGAEAPVKKGLSKKSLPIKRGVPPPKNESEGEAEAAPAAEDDIALQEVEEAEAAPAKSSNRFGKKVTSNRFDKKGKPGSKRSAPEKEEKVAEEDTETNDNTSNRVSRRTTKRSIRGKSVGFKLTLKHKILGGLAIVLILAVVIGYKPGMVWMYTSSLTKPEATVDSRKSAAKSLFEFDAIDAYNLFSVKLTDPDAGVREASIYGMELLGKTRQDRVKASDRLCTEVVTADAPTKVLVIQSLAVIAQEALKSGAVKAETKGAESNSTALAGGDEYDTVLKIAEALMPRADAGETAMEVRAAAVDGLRDLRVMGVCNLLIKLASTENNILKAKALMAIPSTAMPESIKLLLEAVGNQDKEIAEVCKAAFVRVRDQAKSADLAPLLRDPNSTDDVRQAIVDALSKRNNDSTAALALVSAFKDKLPAVRAAAVKGIPTTGIPKDSIPALRELVIDGNEDVRVETANTLGTLSDDDSKKMVLESFKNNMAGKTLNAFIVALGKRVGSKDLKAIGIVMNVLESNPGAESAVHEALALLTGGGGSRVNQRRSWSTEKWKAWYANIMEREKLHKDAMEKIMEIKKHLADDHLTYPKWMKQTETQLDVLAKCEEMCKPDDPEDSPALQAEETKFTMMKEQFQKNASIDIRNGGGD